MANCFGRNKCECARSAGSRNGFDVSKKRQNATHVIANTPHFGRNMKYGHLHYTHINEYVSRLCALAVA